ncbi:hypothetical protein BDW02DRAFT_121715 [Decorospora gaudefroyi]|uniref:Uncharacterized protein n=1 Tax=Decorospora gaudefroyi TaxID=184978 RepID=A0A6A5KPM8_9PLEO|nr:hypothetical protein BDW02DRAFT_121715 [Decorospora gaudefroyi]
MPKTRPPENFSSYEERVTRLLPECQLQTALQAEALRRLISHDPSLAVNILTCQATSPSSARICMYPKTTTSKSLPNTSTTPTRTAKSRSSLSLGHSGAINRTSVIGRSL